MEGVDLVQDCLAVRSSAECSPLLTIMGLAPTIIITIRVLITVHPAISEHRQEMWLPIACGGSGLMIYIPALILAMMATVIHAREKTDSRTCCFTIFRLREPGAR